MVSVSRRGLMLLHFFPAYRGLELVDNVSKNNGRPSKAQFDE